MDGKYISVIFSCFTILAIMISVVSSFSVDSLKYQTFVPTLLLTPHTELESLSWDSSEDQQPEYNSNSLSLSLKLHHVNNLISLRQGKITSVSLFKKRLQRDALRANMLLAMTKSRTRGSADFSSPVISGFKWDSGEYFTRIAVGTPSRDFYMILDTGSVLFWLQCLPCKNCYKQVGAIFNTNKSSSFRGGVPCNSKICGNGNSGYNCHNLKRCGYNVSYGDGSFSNGEFVTETLTFGKSTEVPNVIIGCGHDNEGEFVAAAGLLGLARHKLSFLGQAGRMFGNKFSYCLGNRMTSSESSSSYLTFGDSPACGKAVYTPLVKNPIRDELNIYYYVGLEGISVGGSRVHGIDASTFRIDPNTGGRGGVIVDSGTVVTRLTNHAYLALRDAFRNATKHLKPASKYSLFDTCYHRMKEVEVPTVDLHFAGGANMSLPAANYMIPVDNNGKYCFAFAGMDGFSIIGNVQQQGFGVVFDVANNRLGFAPNTC